MGAWFFMILGPTSSLVPLADAAFDHRLYLPLAAILASLVMAGYLVLRWLVRHRQFEPIMANLVAFAIIAAACATFSVMSISRNSVFCDQISLWSDVVEKAPYNARAHDNLGASLYAAKGNCPEAIEQWETALKVEPKFVSALNNTGVSLAQRGRPDEAVEYYNQGLALKPHHAPIHCNLALVLKQQGKLDEAMAHFKAAIEARPNYPRCPAELRPYCPGPQEL